MNKKSETIEISELIQLLRNQLIDLPDCRIGKNKKYELPEVEFIYNLLDMENLSIE